MERNTMETISAAYTIYTLLNPDERVVISLDSFVEAFKANLSYLLESNPESKAIETGIKADLSKHLTPERAEETLEKGYQKAEETIDDREKLSSMLKQLKQKMKTIPLLGNVLSNVPIMFKLLNSYLKGEYTEIPRKKLIIIVSALSYLIAPIDLIPDIIPVVGLVDDMTVMSVCIKATKEELDRYAMWREANGKGTILEESYNPATDSAQL